MASQVGTCCLATRLHTVQHIEPYQLRLGVKSRFPGTSHGPGCKLAEVSSLRLL